MKNTLIALLFLVPHALGATEVTNPEMSKSYDGKTAYCANLWEVNGLGYQPLLPWVRADGPDVRISFSVAHVICEAKEQGVAWNVRRPYTPWPSKDLDGNPTLFHFDHLEFLLVSETKGLLQTIQAEDSFMQMVDFVVPLEKKLARFERKALERGEPVRVRWEFFMRGRQSVERGGRTTRLGEFAGGSYFIDFTVQRDSAGTLNVTAFGLR